MDEAKDESASFPSGFIEQVTAFFKSQMEDGVQRIVCYDRDEVQSLVIHLPLADQLQAGVAYRRAWEIWRNGGSVILLRSEIREGLPQNENRHPLVEMEGFGL